MQIRLGNRQDEPIIRTIVASAMEELIGGSFPEGREADLTNIEANYFWHDGIFVVAEEDGQIIGVAGAKKKSEEDLELLRLAVVPAGRGRGVARALVDMVVYFAGNMEYRQVVVDNPPAAGTSVLETLGFKQTSDQWWTAPAVHSAAIP